jgi:hypothetical protein
MASADGGMRDRKPVSGAGGGRRSFCRLSFTGAAGVGKSRLCRYEGLGWYTNCNGGGARWLAGGA